MAGPAPVRQPTMLVKPSQHPKGGILQVIPGNVKGKQPQATNSQPKAAMPRLKVTVRRLPPALTEAEFYQGIGDEWKLGEKVDWAQYKIGKVSKDPARPSSPSRAYLHLINPDDVQILSTKVQETKFIDAKGSHSDPALLGPPVVEYSAFNKIPTPKPRKDGRQGTIDQDPEYQDFLESLTNPIAKPPPVDSSNSQETKSDEPGVTPLIQYLRDKKANKIKDPTTPSKVIKSREKKESKDSSVSEKKVVAKNIKEGAKPDKRGLVKIEKSGRENRKASAQANASSSSGKNDSTSTVNLASDSSQGNQDSAKSTPKPERRRERGSASAAAKILQRDLGLVPGPSGRKKKEPAATTNSNTAASSTSKPADAPQNPKPMAILAPQKQAVATTSTVTSPTEPIAPTAAKPQSKAPSGAAKGRGAKPKPTVATSAAPAPSGTRAFLKHANPSQGITEPLLEEAFTIYGTVTKVEIDKKKGFAYIDFAETEGLKTAIAASPVKVAQGQVVVLECKTGPSLQNRNVRTGGGGGGSANSPPTQAGRGGAVGGSRRHRGVRGGGGKAGRAATAESATGAASPVVTSPTIPQENSMAPAAPTEAANG